jgi:aminopeptidase N
MIFIHIARRYSVYLLGLFFLGSLWGCQSTGKNNQQLPVETQPVIRSSLPGITNTPTIQPSLTPTPTTIPTNTPTPEPVSGGASIGDPYAPELGNTGYDVQKYIVRLQLDPSMTILKGDVSIFAQVNEPALSQLSLDFAGYEIKATQINERNVPYFREGQKFWIEFSEPKLFGEIFEIRIEYEGTPLEEASPYVPFLGHVGLFYPGSSIFTLSEPNGAHYWYPCNDHPRDKAEFSFELTVPQDYLAITNGSLTNQENLPDSKTTYVWEHPFPMAPYLAVIAVGKYELIEDKSPGGVAIRHYVFPDLRDTFTAATTITGEAIDWMTNLYGPYPFEAFGYVTTRLVSMASETQTLVVLPETSINEETIIHELAHMWFGNWVSLDTWGDMWLKEGAAIYTYLMWQTRNNPENLDIFMADRTTRILEESVGYPINNLPKSLLLGTDTYWKGAAIYHALRKEIGDEAFFNGLRMFIEIYGGSNASAQDFQQIMEKTSGKSLEEFFRFWLESR